MITNDYQIEGCNFFIQQLFLANTGCLHRIYTHRQKLSNTTFFRRPCFGSCRTEYVGDGNQIF